MNIRHFTCPSCGRVYNSVPGFGTCWRDSRPKEDECKAQLRQAQ